MDYIVDRPYLKRLNQAAKDILNLLPAVSPINTIFVAANDRQTNHVIKAFNRNTALAIEGTDTPYEEALCKLVTENGKTPLVINSLTEHPLTQNHPYTLKIREGSFLGVPIYSNHDEVFGTLCGLDLHPHVFSEEEIQAFQTMGDLLSQVVTLEEWAIHDSLTGLYNRNFIEEFFHSKCQSTERLALLFIELNRFERINGVFGHAMGDSVILTMARRLEQLTGNQDIIARFSGDKFVLIVPETSVEPIKDMIPKFANNLLRTLSEPFLLDGQEIQVTANIGITLYPEDGTLIETLLKNAETGLDLAKKDGGNTYCCYHPYAVNHLLSEFEIENELRQGLIKDEFKLFYQPQINLVTGKLEGFETLVRWQHPSKGLLSPDTFISIAEDSGWISALGEWVIDQVCEVSKKWESMGYPPIQLSFNLSPKQFQDPDLFIAFKKVIDRHCVNPSILKLEITESLMIKDMALTKNHLDRFKALGVKIAVDDFGKGYSSLSYIKGLPIDTLKIDRAFVVDLEESQDSKYIVQAIIQMARDLNLFVIAEGIETESQARILKEFGCHHGQGYFFSKPIPEDLILHYLDQHHPKK